MSQPARAPASAPRGTGGSRTTPQRSVPAGVAAALTVAVVAVSTSSILVRVAEAPALSLSFWRCALGAVALAPFAVRARRSAPALDRGQWRQLGWSGALLAGHFAAFISALSYTTVASASVLVTCAPLFVGVGAAVFLGEPPARRTWTGIALATAGAAVVAGADLGDGALGARALFGDGLAFAGAALVAGYLLIGRAARRRLPVTVYATGVYSIAAGLLLVACLAAGAPLTGFPAATWWAIAGLVAGPQLLGHTVFNALLERVSATVVAVVVLAEPVCSTLLAFVLLGELPATFFWAGAPLLLAGVFVSASRGRTDVPDAAVPGAA